MQRSLNLELSGVNELAAGAAVRPQAPPTVARRVDFFFSGADLSFRFLICSFDMLLRGRFRDMVHSP
jgi:hypothetical protein